MFVWAAIGVAGPGWWWGRGCWECVEEDYPCLSLSYWTWSGILDMVWHTGHTHNGCIQVFPCVIAHLETIIREAVIPRLAVLAFPSEMGSVNKL